MNRTRATVEAQMEAERLERCREYYAEQADDLPALDYDGGFIVDLDEEDGVR